ncbi:preprotein translocase subunit YajC [Streptomyces solincola]|uniref:Preprotein translocase subunit YajC n=1 Tax=Streptomyces solincola TaxID=2100817 RepID=A0A2S9PQ80_9ACTN|nr:preprotein translocase subunit YajC [Streptomyces solincola]PRH76570.1 preprotein translocase subunit YajC [Streptomyces solincola]
MNVMTLLPFIVLIGAMFLMTRSAKKKQQQAAQMRNQMQPGSGVRTIGGMYATVKEVGDDTVLLEVAPGVHAFYAKNAIGAVLEDEEYNRIIHGDGETDGAPVVPDDASALTADGDAAGDRVDLGKKDAEPGTAGLGKADLGKETTAGEQTPDAADPTDKRDGDTDAK